MATNEINVSVVRADTLIVANSAIFPAASLTNVMVAANADISASKLEHQRSDTYSQPNSAATAETRVLSRVYGASCVVLGVHCGSIAAAVGDSTCTIDVKKNGTTILSAPIVLDSGNSAYDGEAGTISVPAGVADDVYTAHITISAGSGTLPTGVYVTLVRTEKAA